VTNAAFVLLMALNNAAAAAGVRLTINGATLLLPSGSGNTVTAWAGWAVPVTVRDQNRGSAGLRFATWSDGGARTHNFVVPNTGSIPLTADFNVTVGGFVPSLDIDNDGAFDAATDGVLLLRHWFGIRGAALTANSLGATAERNAASISAYISSLSNAFDADDNRGVSATTDGLLVLRYLLGLRGTALTQGALGVGALRTDPTDIANYLQSLIGQ
jgi:hypothetical protein